MHVGDAVRLNRYWKDSPPLHVMVAGYLGITNPRKLSDDQLGSMFGLAPPDDALAAPIVVPTTEEE